jgi:hypothetical protein
MRHAGKHISGRTATPEKPFLAREHQLTVGVHHSQTCFGKVIGMRFHGNIWRDGRHWLAEIPLLDAMTQGTSKKGALAMVEDLLESLINHAGFCATTHPGADGEFTVSTSDTRAAIVLMLRRQRSRSGLSLGEVAARLGASSRNTYARYEQGASQPTLEKLNQLLQAVAPDEDLVLGQSRARGQIRDG